MLEVSFSSVLFVEVWSSALVLSSGAVVWAGLSLYDCLCRRPPLRRWGGGWGSYWLRPAPPLIQPRCTTTTSTWRRQPTSSSWPNSPSGEGVAPPAVADTL